MRVIAIDTESSSLTDGERDSVLPTDDCPSDEINLGGWSNDDTDDGGAGQGIGTEVVFEGAFRDNRIDDEEKNAFCRARASWSGPLAKTGGSRGHIRGKTTDTRYSGSRFCEQGRAATRRVADNRSKGSGPTTVLGGKSATSVAVSVKGDSMTGQQRLHYHRTTLSLENRRCGDGDGTEVGGWESAPDDILSRRKERRGGNSGEKWHFRGALGRRPASREAVRQLRVSERLHGLGETLAKKRESTRRRRDELQQARVTAVALNRVKQCRVSLNIFRPNSRQTIIQLGIILRLLLVLKHYP